MNWPEAVILLVAGILAGGINAVVGSGSLVTFPVLIALGYPPIVANVTNNIGILPGSVVAAWVNRHELAGQRRRLIELGIVAAVGGAIGAGLLLLLPATVFDFVVPALLILAISLVILGPIFKTRLSHWQAPADSKRARVSLGTSIFGTAIYGGYFGAAQGVLLLSFLSMQLRGTLHQANAYKNVLTATANVAAAIVFVSSMEVAWLAVLAIAIGAFIGGQIGARVGRRIPDLIYRIAIVVIGLLALAHFLLT